MADVFLSYSKVDNLIAGDLAEELRREGYSVWWDTELYGGEDFHDVILKALDEAKAVIVIWSISAVKSQWVRGEAQHAQSQGKLIPTKVDGLGESAIPLNFRALHTEAVENRVRILRAVERLTGKKSRTALAAGAVRPPQPQVASRSEPAQAFDRQAPEATRARYAPAGQENRYTRQPWEGRQGFDWPLPGSGARLAIGTIGGVIAGWLASVVVGGGGGLLRYVITGLIGAFLAGFVFQMAGWRLNLGNEWLEQIVIAAIGAIIVVILARIIV